MSTNRRIKVILDLPRRSSLWACLLLAGLVAGCSSVKPQVDEGAIKARSFSFFDPGPRQLPAYAEERKEAHLMVQQAIMKTMAAKGVSYVPKGGDVTVAYLIIVGNNGSTTSLNGYFGYSEDSDALLKKVHAEQTGSDSRGYFEAGTLVIDLVNPASSKLLQRRSAQAQLVRNLPLETRSARVQSLVEQMLKDVPITP